MSKRPENIMLLRIVLTAIFLLLAIGTSQNLILNNLHGQRVLHPDGP